MTSQEEVLDDRAAFEAYAADFAVTLRAGDVVGLRGALGAGKTTFVRAVVRRLHGTDAAVSSPTFVFRHRYEGVPPIEHVDCYRIDDPVRDPAELGLEEAFGGGVIALVEWPERAGDWIPSPRIEVAIEGAGEGPRRVRIDRP